MREAEFDAQSHATGASWAGNDGKGDSKERAMQCTKPAESPA